MFTNSALRNIEMNRPLYIFGGLVAVAVSFASCKTDSNSPGVEYMPDMYRSPAIEAYVDYGNTKVMDLTQLRKDEMGVVPVLVRQPAPGSVPYTGSAEAARFVMPYALNNTPEDYERAALEVKSPLIANELNVTKGQAIYTKMCTHCHGKEGHGDGAISKNGFIMGIPDYAGKLKDLPEGKMFHTITYGKGLMGQHASQLNQRERWQVIEYVKCLQKGISTPEFDGNGMLKVAAEAAAAPADSTTKM
jgi:mono/diheme cytochrome c family protein